MELWHIRVQSMHRILMHGLHVPALKLPRAANEENDYLCYLVSVRHQIMQRKISKVMEVRNWRRRPRQCQDTYKERTPSLALNLWIKFWAQAANCEYFDDSLSKSSFFRLNCCQNLVGFPQLSGFKVFIIRDLASRLRLPTLWVQGNFLFVQMKMKDDRLILQMTRLLFSTAMKQTERDECERIREFRDPVSNINRRTRDPKGGGGVLRVFRARLFRSLICFRRK